MFSRELVLRLDFFNIGAESVSVLRYHTSKRGRQFEAEEESG